MSGKKERPNPIDSRTGRIRLDLGYLSVFEKIYIAYSGGMDSHVLLHLCALDEQLIDKITAVYVDHGLQLSALEWGRHCRAVCAELGVSFLAISVNAKNEPGESPEEAARNARYAVLKPLIHKRDVLLLAQHREDQLETVLLQLFRGSGLKGLSGMSEVANFGQGKLMRPLLHISKSDIMRYADRNGLNWVEDPSNLSSRYDRNFLRNEIIPYLKQRWPSLDKTVSRSAQHCAQAQQANESRAENLLQAVIDTTGYSIDLTGLQSYAESEQYLVLRQWFNNLGLKMPSLQTLQQLFSEIISANKDAEPVLSAQGRQFRRYRNRLYSIAPQTHITRSTVIWPAGQTRLRLADREYEIVESAQGIAKECWRNSIVAVRFRSGGETIDLPGRKGHHSLKKLYQEAGIPAWERAGQPLIYLNDRLAAVGELWISAGFFTDAHVPCLRIVCRKINPKAHDDCADSG